jgi:hypothetical protein
LIDAEARVFELRIVPGDGAGRREKAAPAKEATYSSAYSIRSATFDDRRPITISVMVPIAVLFDDHCLVTIAMITLSNNFTFADAIPVTVVRPNCYANRPYADANLFCVSRRCAADAGRRNKY